MARKPQNKNTAFMILHNIEMLEMFQIRLIKDWECLVTWRVSKYIQEFRRHKKIQEIVVFKSCENGSISTLSMISTSSYLFNMYL